MLESLSGLPLEVELCENRGRRIGCFAPIISIIEDTHHVRGTFRLTGAIDHSVTVEQWLSSRSGELGTIARIWFAEMRRCGNDVREVMHDGCPTVCVGDAAFAYVGLFKTHVNLGFFHGTALPDPAGLLQGTGKYMRHVKVAPGLLVDDSALETLIRSAYRDIVARLNAEPSRVREG